MCDEDSESNLVQVKIEDGELEGGEEDECFGWGDDEDWVKTEPFSDEEEECAVKKTRSLTRKPVREMSGEEREVMRGKWREGARAKRAKGERKRKTGGRKPVGQMSEEERERVKVKWREEARAKRAKMRERMSEEEREAYLAVQRERRRAQREAMRTGGLSEVELEERRRVEREKKRVKRAGMSEEEKRGVVRKVLERRKQRLTTMGEEERQNLRVNNYFRYVAWVGKRSDEDKEAERRRRAAAARVKLQALTEEERAERNRVARERRANASEEKKEEGRRKLREAYYRRRGIVVSDTSVRLRKTGKKGNEEPESQQPRVTRGSKAKEPGKSANPLIAEPKLILPPNYGLRVEDFSTGRTTLVDAVQESEYGSEQDRSDPPQPLPSPSQSSSPHTPQPLELSAAIRQGGTSLETEPPPPPIPPDTLKRKHEHDDRPTRPKKPRTAAQLRRGPRGANLKFDVVRDAVCEECGNSYNRVYLPEHKRMFHNPQYVDGVCLLCNGEFGSGAEFRKHFKRAHQVAEEEGVVGKKPAVCDLCGVKMKSVHNLKSHQYYVHGDGLKKENHVSCSVCGLLFKTRVQLYSHSRKRHPGVNVGGGVKCYKCGVSGFSGVGELKEHVRVSHVGYYFPCEYCSAVRFSERALRFHVRNYCKAVGEEVRGKLVRSWGKEDGTVERMTLDCEVCGKGIALFSLKRHYAVVHGVGEVEYSCWGCGKKFKSRQYWVLHMEGVCGLDVDFDRVRCLNAELDNGVVVRNVGGVKGGAGEKKHGKTRGRRKKKEH